MECLFERRKLETTVEEFKSINQCNEKIINELETENKLTFRLLVVLWVYDVQNNYRRLENVENEYKSINEYNEQIIDELTAKNMELEEQIR